LNEPHDPNVTTDTSARADSPDAGRTATYARPADPLGAADTYPVPPLSADAPASGLPVVPGYRVLREIARGGMGRVLAAFDLGLDRDVALKVLLPGAAADRFVRESKITARLPHPGIPPVHALGTLADGSPFLAMKLIAGQTLAVEMKTADRPRLLQAFTQVCQAVGFAHSRGVIHRDLKPANVMVGAFGEVQVMDWGLAKDLEERPDNGERRGVSPPVEPEEPLPTGGLTPRRSPDASDHTQAGTVLGTPAYMAPEQARGEAADARADVFALGGILCAILTGQPPFRGKSALEIIQRAGAADLAEALARLDGCGADADLLALCRRCLSPDPADRPANGQAVADGMTAYLVGVQERLQVVERERAVAVAREAEQRKRRRVQFTLTAAVLLVLVAGVAVSVYFAFDAKAEAKRANDNKQRADDKADLAIKEANRANDEEKKAKIQTGIAQWNERLAKDSNHAIKLDLAWRAREQSDWERMRQLLAETHADYGQTLENRLVTALWVKHAFSLKNLMGHTGYVYSVAFSPDGKRIVTGGGDPLKPNQPGEVKVWDADTGTEKLALKGLTGSVYSVCFSPDGKRILTGSWDNTARVWDADTGTEKLALKGHTGYVFSVCFSPDGKRIVSGSWELDWQRRALPGEVKVWDAETGTEKLALKGHTNAVTSVCFSPDGKRILTGSADRTARLWDADTGTE